MKLLLTVALLLVYLSSPAQKIFFKSPQSFSEKELQTFYSSFQIKGNLLLFNGADYKLYAYDKTTGQQRWVYYLGRKSNITPFFAGDYIWAMSDQTESVQLDSMGHEIKKLSFSVETQPVIKNNIMYTTGIYDGGALIAYDLQKDSVIWTRFLAHGCSREPYYLNDKIIANAEGHSWLPVYYNGQLNDSSCDIQDGRYPSELPCADKFHLLTHDNKKIDGKLAEKICPDRYNEPSVLTTAQNTFILSEGLITVLGNNRKKKYSEFIYKLGEHIGQEDYAPSIIVKGDENSVVVLYNHKLITIDHKKKRLLKVLDLEEWLPHQVMMEDNNRFWLISKKDGLLYGMESE